jgi:cysteine desulfurase
MEGMARSYLDWNATTPLRPEAKQQMIQALEAFGNPSSIHREGRSARRLMEDSRAAIEGAIGAPPRSLVFTSGATEANTFALMSNLRCRGVNIQNAIISAIEHPSVLAGGRLPAERIAIAPVTVDGTIDLAALEALLIQSGPALVSVMAANNETGAIQPTRAVADLVRKHGGILHVDAAQALGKIPFDMKALGADMVSLSAHKLGGPKGIGALVVDSCVENLAPVLRGGGQERGQRAGTENLVGIVGFSAAAQAAMAAMPREATVVAKLRQRLESGLKQDSAVQIFSEGVERLPNTTLFTRSGLRAETAVIAFDLEGVAVSSGSACSSGKVQPSHVLTAMGVPDDLNRAAIRVSLGWDTTEKDVDHLLSAWRKIAIGLGKGELRNIL